MHLTGGKLVLSASDLTGFLECPHLTQQELAATRGEVVRPESNDPELDLLASRGDSSSFETRGRAAIEGRIPDIDVSVNSQTTKGNRA